MISFATMSGAKRLKSTRFLSDGSARAALLAGGGGASKRGFHHRFPIVFVCGPFASPARHGTYMADPKFRPGQMVEFVQANRLWAQGPYEVVRLMPSETGEPRYRIRSLQEMHERVAWEHELRGIHRG